jgi:hypothetical protein
MARRCLKGINSIAGGNATGSKSFHIPTLEGSNFCLTLSGSGVCRRFSEGDALGY